MPKYRCSFAYEVEADNAMEALNKASPISSEKAVAVEVGEISEDDD